MATRVKFLTDDWCALTVEEAKAMPTVPGATGIRTATIRYPDESTRSFVMRFVDGVITEVTPGTIEGASYRIEMPLDIYLLLNEGDYDAFDRAILRGAIRMLGDQSEMQGIARLMRSEGYQGVLTRVHQQTDYD